ncbi:hypothetical protein HY991_00220 [Candidatus Micrarchaeota archaeon]|nr:hypothetical protein [Candidatus Micrarchaeota archaeon]
MTQTIKAFLLEVEHVTKGGEAFVKLMLKEPGENGRVFKLYDYFEPYFFLLPDEPKQIEKVKKQITEISVFDRSEKIKTKRVEEDEREIDGKKEKLLRVFVCHPQHVSKIREEAKRWGKTFEYTIPYVRRYLIDKNLFPTSLVEIEADELGEMVKIIRNVEEKRDEAPSLRKLSFDIEVFNPKGIPEPEKDPCLMISFFDGREGGVLSHTKRFSADFVKSFSSEKEMIEQFREVLKTKKIDLLYSYNGDVFDIPYLRERAKRNKIKLLLGRGTKEPTIRARGIRGISQVSGRIHLDVFNAIAFLDAIGAIRMPRLTLEKVYAELLGGEKEDIRKLDIHKIWDEGGKELDRLASYCKSDSIACFQLGEYVLSSEIELSKVTGTTLFDASRSTTGQLVEALLMRRAFERKELIPNKPKPDEISYRLERPIEGAYVKMPEPGLYENIAVLDFRSLYPSIIISHNIDPSTLNCGCCSKEDASVSPLGHRFCKKRRGLIPSVLSEVIYARIKLKERMRKVDKDSEEYKRADARQWALKIVANSFYGYLAYARSRWYSRECGESTTAWGRYYIQETINKAEEAGFKVLYADSITSERFVTLLDPNGFVRIKNIQELFGENKKDLFIRGEKEVINLKGYKSLSIDPSSLEPTWKEIQEIIRHKTSKKIFRVVQKYGETRVTEDHSLITLEKGLLSETRPQDLPGKHLAKLWTAPPVQEISKIDLFELLKQYEKSTIYKKRCKISRVHCDENWVWFGWTNRKKHVKLKRFLEVGSREFDSLCRLVGAYVAEGSASTAETAFREMTSIASQDKNWLSSLKEDFLNLFSNASASIIQSNKGTRTLAYNNHGSVKIIQYVDKTFKMQIGSELSAVLFKVLCGQKSHGKRLPEFVFHVPRRCKELVLQEMIKGDGSRSVNKRLGYSKEYVEKNFRYTSKSLELASGLSLLLNQLGIKYYVQYRPAKKVYSIGTSTKTNAAVKTKIIEEDYDGYVYDLSVKDTHIFSDSCGQVLLHNTDSLFLLFEKDGKKVHEFQQKINSELPEKMELEIEGIYPRGIFVSKKQEEKGAKKKYALVDKEGKIKIRGFELVRRDWSRVARHTQREVLEILLREGNVEKAIELVRKRIKELKEGKIPLGDCVIYTHLRKKVKSYEVTAPEISAFQKAREKGFPIEEGAVVGYVITKKGKSISDKAHLFELAEDYDPDYYINHQLLPAVLKILGALGFKEEDIKTKGTQRGLGNW